MLEAVARLRDHLGWYRGALLLW